MERVRAARITWLCFGLILVGCDRKSPTSPTVSASQPRVVTANEQSTVSRHNGQFFNDRTTRWQVPVNMFLLREEARTVIRDWEIQTRGAVQFNFTNYNPGEGIRLRRTDLPGDVVGFSGLLLPPTNIGVIVAQAPRETHSLRIPQVISNRIRNCDVFLDPILWNADPAALWHVIKHEVGHCLGFVDHTWESDSVMSQNVCCPMKIIPRVAAMMRELYTLPIGTEVH